MFRSNFNVNWGLKELLFLLLLPLFFLSFFFFFLLLLDSFNQLFFQESRIVVNAILILIFVLESLCGVVAFSVTCYKACQCCRDGYDTCRMCSLSKLCRLCRDDRGNSNIVSGATNHNLADV